MKWLKTITVQLFTGANIATVLLLWLCCGVTYLQPDAAPKLSLMALAFPGFLLVNVLFVVFWLIFKVKRVWVPLAGLVLCGSFVRDYVPFNLASEAPAGALKLVSYNTKGFGGREAVDSLGNNAVMDYLAGTEAEIICLQETYGSAKAAAFKDSMRQAGYEVWEAEGNMLLSRLHILSADTFKCQTSPSLGLWAWLQHEDDSLLLVNCHFVSDHLSPELKEAYRQSIRSMEHDSLRRGVTPVLRMLIEAAPARAAQADALAAFIASHADVPAVVCGDFNDTPVSYTHRVLTNRLASAFRQSGNGLGFTFHEHGFPVRIDHILFSPECWRSSGTYVDRSISYSDHYPLVTFLAPRP